MTDPLLPQGDGDTELTPEERERLIPSYVTFRRELNEAEQANIVEAQSWAFSRKRDVLDEALLTSLHTCDRNTPPADGGVVKTPQGG